MTVDVPAWFFLSLEVERLVLCCSFYSKNNYDVCVYFSTRVYIVVYFLRGFMLEYTIKRDRMSTVTEAFHLMDGDGKRKAMTRR